MRVAYACLRVLAILAGIGIYVVASRWLTTVGGHGAWTWLLMVPVVPVSVVLLVLLGRITGRVINLGARLLHWVARWAITGGASRSGSQPPRQTSAGGQYGRISGRQNDPNATMRSTMESVGIFGFYPRNK